MNNSQKNIALISLLKKGYRIDELGVLISPDGKILKGSTSSSGYKCLSHRHLGKINKVPFHRIQAFQKYGNAIFEKGIEVRHKNGNKKDNSWDNILIGTHSENMMDIPIQVRINRSMTATSFVRKHNKDEIREFHLKSKSYAKTMEKFNISSKGTLNFILKK